jgi:hypothetical protein
MVNMKLCADSMKTYTASESRKRWFMLYGTHSVPLRKHFAHLASLATVSHLILCLLHSAPMRRKSLQPRRHKWYTYMLSSGMSVAGQAGAHPRARHLRSGASALGTVPIHYDRPSKVYEDSAVKEV